MQKTRLRRYAKLIATVGINIQKGQEVVISAGLDQPEFVAMLTEECYRAGASLVTVDWNYPALTRLDVKYRTKKSLGTLSEEEEARWKHNVKALPCRIRLSSSGPDAMKGINQKKLSEANRALYPQTRAYRDAMENRFQWCIAAVPGVEWAKKLFPELSKKQAVEKLWVAILDASRVTDDPVGAWEEHNRALAARCEHLNALKPVSLTYRNALGTDLTVGLMPEAQFMGGGDTALSGVFFDPNIPTEEVFTSPKRGLAEGIVYATKPLSYRGQLIEDFSVRFENGRAVEVKAAKNEALLKEIIAMDEGAAYLGECALVPFNSPIGNTGLLFYNTLFDENASCHLALGRGYADTIKNYQNYTLEECREMGLNDSMIHVDFMIGSADLSVTGRTADGKTVKIFENGEWAF